MCRDPTIQAIVISIEQNAIWSHSSMLQCSRTVEVRHDSSICLTSEIGYNGGVMNRKYGIRETGSIKVVQKQAIPDAELTTAQPRDYLLTDL